ncbi:MAG: hypothetical protein ACREPG_11855 [Candidatus Binatia bacterium]
MIDIGLPTVHSPAAYNLGNCKVSEIGTRRLTIYRVIENKLSRADKPNGFE